jgi:hypothetical protein
MNRNLVGSIYMYGRFCIKLPQSRMKGEWHRPTEPLALLICYRLIFLYHQCLKYTYYPSCSLSDRIHVKMPPVFSKTPPLFFHT